MDAQPFRERSRVAGVLVHLDTDRPVALRQQNPVYVIPGLDAGRLLQALVIDYFLYKIFHSAGSSIQAVISWVTRLSSGGSSI